MLFNPMIAYVQSFDSGEPVLVVTNIDCNWFFHFCFGNDVLLFGLN